MEQRVTTLTPSQIDHLRREAKRICGFDEEQLRQHHLDLVPVFVSQYLELSGRNGQSPQAEQIDFMQDILNGCLAAYHACKYLSQRQERVIYLQHSILIQHNLLNP